MKIIFAALACLLIGITVSVKAQQPAPMMPGMYKKLVHFANPQKESCTLTIVDSTGKTLQSFKDIKTDTITIDLRTLNKGKYTYTVTNRAGAEIKHGMVMGRHTESVSAH